MMTCACSQDEKGNVTEGCGAHYMWLRRITDETERSQRIFNLGGQLEGFRSETQQLRDKVAMLEAKVKALEEGLRRSLTGGAFMMLNAPCVWCGYNGEGYYQSGTHAESCRWHKVGGFDYRLAALKAASEG